MKIRKRNLANRFGRLLFASFVLFACLTLFTDSVQAQRPAPTPILVKDVTPVGEPERADLEGGKYKLVYKNKAGQIVKEEEYALGIKIRTKEILMVYPNGQEATVKFTYYAPFPRVTREEGIYYDRFGNPHVRLTITPLPYPEDYSFRYEKWNRSTKQWEALAENERFNRDTGRLEKVPPSNTPPSDASNNRSSAANGFAVASQVVGGLNATTFDTPRGKIHVNLPDDMAAGDSLSGTVVAEPEGKDDKTRTKNQGELSGYIVELEKQQTSSTNRILKLSIPAAISTIYMILRDKKGKEIARCELPVDRQPRRPPSLAEGFGLPTMGQQGRPIEVTGAFDGDFTTTNLTVGGEGMEILAESPRKLVVRNSSLKVGPTQLVVSEQGRTATGEFRSLGIRLSAPKLDLLRGEQTTLTVMVLGLEGIKAPVPLVLENKSPGIISMGSANIERISINPSQVQGGTYTTQRPLTGIQRGAFTIIGTVTTDGN